MRYLKKVWKYLKTGDFKTLFSRTNHVLRRAAYHIRAWIEDCLIGGISINKKKPSKFTDIGAYDTQSTDYCWLDQIFSEFPLPKDSVFVDVGCGEGRVLTYLYLRGFRGKMIGIELDPEIAQTAQKRTRKCANIQICQGNVLECGDIIRDATAFYLFNPFDEEVLTAFIKLIEKVCDHPVYLYYSNDRYRSVLDRRKHWFILRRYIVKGPTIGKWRYTLYRYRPDME